MGVSCGYISTGPGVQGLESASLLVLEKHLNDCVFNDATMDNATVDKVRETLKLWSRHTVGAG